MDWGYKACINISISISTSTSTSTSINISISTSTSTNIHRRSRTKFQEHSHLCLLRQVYTTGQNAIENVMLPLPLRQEVGHNTRRSGALSVSGHLCLLRLLRDERGNANGRGNGRRVIFHTRPNRGNIPTHTCIITTRIRTRSIRRRILRLEAIRTCISSIITHHLLQQVRGAGRESGSMKLWVVAGGTGTGKGMRCHFH